LAATLAPPRVTPDSEVRAGALRLISLAWRRPAQYARHCAGVAVPIDERNPELAIAASYRVSVNIRSIGSGDIYLAPAALGHLVVEKHLGAAHLRDLSSGCLRDEVVRIARHDSALSDLAERGRAEDLDAAVLLGRGLHATHVQRPGIDAPAVIASDGLAGVPVERLAAARRVQAQQPGAAGAGDLEGVRDASRGNARLGWTPDQ
jgi:hypothetical protein